MSKPGFASGQFTENLLSGGCGFRESQMDFVLADLEVMRIPDLTDIILHTLFFW